VAASLSWLDVSAEQQRRVRELIKLFEEPGTQDELGVGPVRDAFSDLLFPGTSTVQTRARYFLFVPWHFELARKRGLRGQALLDRVDKSERQLIERFRVAGMSQGLIGSRAGARVKNLPSTIYWTGLQRLGILRGRLSPTDVAAFNGSVVSEADEFASRSDGPWVALPILPPGFPDENSGGFDLTRDEALWLQARILDSVHGVADTLLAHLVRNDEPRLIDTAAAWEEPTALSAPKPIAELLEHARRFSHVMHGAALLYNLLVSDEYERAGFTTLQGRVSLYTERLTGWADELDSDASLLRDSWPEFWLAVARGNSRVPPLARAFVERWTDLARSDTLKLASNQDARSLVRNRVLQLRGGRAVLGNKKQLALWGGASGDGPLDYRWGTVRRIVLDVQEGLARAGA
jgi:hypothetical protein